MGDMAVWFSASACVLAAMACWLWRRLARPASNLPSTTRHFATFLAWLAIGCLAWALRGLWMTSVLWPIPSAEADLQYFQRLDRQLANVQSSAQLSSEQFELAKELREHALEWTARELVDSSETSVRRAALLALAADIRPVPGSYQVVTDYLADEAADIEARLAEAIAERKRLIERQATLSAEFRRLNESTNQPIHPSDRPESNGDAQLTDELEPATQDDDQGDEEDLEAEEQAELAAEQEAAERQAKVRDVAAQLTEAETLALRLRRDIQRLQARQTWRADRMQEPGGLSVTNSWLRLPVVVSGGWRWWVGLWLSASMAAAGLLKLWLTGATERRQPTMLLVVGLFLLQWWLMLLA